LTDHAFTGLRPNRIGDDNVRTVRVADGPTGPAMLDDVDYRRAGRAGADEEPGDFRQGPVDAGEREAPIDVNPLCVDDDDNAFNQPAGRIGRAGDLEQGERRRGG
jgi:hypothetical protein